MAAQMEEMQRWRTEASGGGLVGGGRVAEGAFDHPRLAGDHTQQLRRVEFWLTAEQPDVHAQRTRDARIQQLAGRVP